MNFRAYPAPVETLLRLWQPGPPRQKSCAGGAFRPGCESLYDWV